MTAPISATEPDWSREAITRFWHPGPKLLRAIRRYQALRGAGVWGRICSKYWVVNHRFWSIVTQCEIDLTTEIGGGLLLPHPNGIVINTNARIGPNCLIFHQVTLADVVTLGGHVDIGAGAKLIGPLKVGDNVRIGANAVVTRDVAAGQTMVGIPARPISASQETRGDEQGLPPQNHQ